MDDFIFGSMDTDALRLRHHKKIHSEITHQSARIPRDPLPGQPVQLVMNVGSAHEIKAAWVYYSTEGTDPSGENGVPTHGNVLPLRWVSSEWDDLTWGYCHTYQCTIPGQPDQTVVRYRIAAETAEGQTLYADDGAYYAYAVDTYVEPEWVKDAIIYHIMVDRFAVDPGKTWNPVKAIDDIYGGTLKGIHSRLDYIENSGFNTLYLSPIFPCNNHHRYNAYDYFEIDPAVGTKEDFKALLDDLHKRGMHLILDYVPNHWSDQHKTFQDAIKDPKSPYRDWYTFEEYPDKYDSFFNVPVMPRVNLRNPDARKYMIDSARYWVEFGVDGLRLDYAIGPTPDFWADFRLAVRNANPQAWTIGEVVDSVHAQTAFEGLLDGCLDFVLLEALRQTFATRVWSPSKFASFLRGHQAQFATGFSRPCFLDNHDMDRFLWAAGNDKNSLKLAAMCQYTLSGSPMVYYGTEVGLSQNCGIRECHGGFGRLEEARLPMPWDDTQDQNLYDFYQKLNHLRMKEETLRRGDLIIDQVSKHGFSYVRKSGASQVLCLFNLSKESQCFKISRPWKSVLLSTQDESIDPHSTTNTIDLAPMLGLILK